MFNRKQAVAWVSAFLAVPGLITTAVAETNVWIEAGPDVASISRVEYSASGNTVAYARGGDKFWKSSDAGATWSEIAAYHTVNSTFVLDRDPNNAGIILLDGPNMSGTPLRSVNAGASFNFMNPDPMWSPEAWGFGTDGVAYVTASGSYVYRSTDHGASWTSTSQMGLPSATSSMIYVASKMVVDPTNSNIVYLGYRQSDLQSIYRSVDGGVHWTAGAGLLGATVMDIAIHPTTTSTLFAATFTGIYVSTDSGANWAKVPDPSGTGVATVGMASVAVEPSQPLTVYAGGLQGGELFRSTDGGATWARRDTGILARTITSIAPRPGVSGDVLIGTTHTMYRTTDGGASWAPSASHMKGAAIGAINNGSKLRVGFFDGGVYESSDGTNWSPINNSALRAVVPSQRMSAVVEIHEASRLFVSLAQDGVFASPDKGASWLAQSPTFNPSDRHNWGGFITEKGTGPVHYVGTSDGVYKTSNDGDSWSLSSSGITMPVIMTLAKNTDGSKLFAGTFNGGVFKSTDGGASWLPINTGLTNLEIGSLAFDDSGSNALLVGTANGLFVTTDDGASYTRLADVPGPGVQPAIEAILVEDFLHGSLYVACLDHVFRSVDRGLTWQDLSGALYLPFNRITSLAGTGPGVLYAGATYTGLQQYTVATDLQLTGTTPSAGTFPVGTEFSWRATVRNNGPAASTFSRFSWSLPSNVEVKSPTPARGTCSVSSTLVSCDLGVMQVGDSITVDMTVKGIAVGTIQMQPMASAAESDTDPTNNTFSNSGVKIGDAQSSTSTPPPSNGSGSSGGGAGAMDELLLGLLLIVAGKEVGARRRALRGPRPTGN